MFSCRHLIRDSTLACHQANVPSSMSNVVIYRVSCNHEYQFQNK